MKIALCISGHLREGDSLCFPSVKKYLLDKYDTDIFVSSFKEMGAVNYCMQSNHPVEDNNDVSDRIHSIYKPVRSIIEDANAPWLYTLQKRWNNISTRNGSKVWQVVAMWRNIYEAQRLRRMYEAETGTKYDLVIRTRFDNELISDIVAQTQYKNENGLILKTGHRGFFDQTFWGAPEYISTLAECWFYIDSFVNENNSKSFENAENIATKYLTLSEIPYTVRTDIQISITKPINGRYIT